jgi:hypothetical protein
VIDPGLGHPHNAHRERASGRRNYPLWVIGQGKGHPASVLLAWAIVPHNCLRSDRPGSVRQDSDLPA